MIELAELLQAPVSDRKFRMNFPTRHPLYGTGNVADADVILGLDVPDLWMALNANTPINRLGMRERKLTKADAKVIHIFAGDLYSKSNYQDFGRYQEVDLSIAADAQTSMPELIEACKKLITADRKRAFEARRQKLDDASKKLRQRDLEAAAFGFDASPISTARVSAELWNALKGEDWSLVSDVTFFSWWPLRLWDFTKHYQYIGGHGAYGVGYQAPASVGAALANRKYGRVSVNIQCDGDLNYAPGVLWTAAHHKIPLLTVMHNNRAYHQELMFVEDMAARAQRGVDKCTIGTTITDPNISYSKMAAAYGMYSAGPISDPKDLGPALKEAIQVVKRGEPALIDVLTQPR
jgi:thiamine pyrophosphate-dependent acetolactate synthase large subunit-like protein